MQPHDSHLLPNDLARTLLVILLGAVLIGASLWILLPFMLAITWAIMVVVASWPLMLSVERYLGGRRWAAVTAMTLGLLMAMFLPLTAAIVTLVENADRIVALGASLQGQEALAAPDWMKDLPLVGTSLSALWEQFAASGLQGLASRVAPYAGDMTRWFAARVGGMGMMLLQFLLTIAVSAVLYARGEDAALLFRRVLHRLGGERAVAMGTLASGAIRGVALGVGVTALIQALLGGIGLVLTGIPFATVLTALMFMLCIAQLGAGPVLVPAVIWLFWSDHTGWAVFLTVWTLLVVNLDNFLRPWLIRRGADLPLLLIIAGVIGGIISFGLIGLFLGPLILAVAYTLLEAWLEETSAEEAGTLDAGAAPATPAPDE
ncbi:MAG: hypothetical protein CGU28_01555 [Candidatus Dactylopiibacterium carminicum]|uniref:AI-2E family transporter YdiK n=1 Tax=Candidatus Dactylopiibacterium carminicum TaxID=857335 RepID=A0A272EUF3_9RHOO|nr:AI-2E family transporter YdiK [Candidatus Dactylopiibacterium carminicum]KAF7599768.1 hypothetical protein BGI27_06095 [Candidatus Dactylopiibacterium carminicum]PAS93722.1 MAG: hypothetical protein CGU29_06535 [Candidatus Dactylopiibacterium carminicum]PAS98277.1 MAG: hypothetical protein CGU28_01555 [Candidatus Dactylopiibacterium carminicum]PAS99769.1 MAG: hypothetical protein BSR46_06130 [Candidatus Dactylopiibacterium carminicum]